MKRTLLIVGLLIALTLTITWWVWPADIGNQIEAAWEEVTLTVPEEPGASIRLDRKKLEWFVDFLETRARIKVPKWWGEAVLDSSARRRIEIYPGSPKEYTYHDVGLDSAKAPQSITLEKKDDSFILSTENESVSLPDGVVRKTFNGKKVWGCYSALFKPTRCYVAAHDELGSEYYLSCIDRASGNLLWKTKVRGCCWMDTTGQYFSWVSVMEQDDRVFVFGIASIGMYAEAFRSADGANLFRFSSTEFIKKKLSGPGARSFRP